MGTRIVLILFLCARAIAQAVPDAKPESVSPEVTSPDVLCVASPTVCGTQRDVFNPKRTDNIDDAQKLTLRLMPHPYLEIGIAAMPGGYFPLAEWGEAGLEVESKHIVATASATYDNGHKTNDADQPNPKGHDRYLRADVYWRLTAVGHPKWFIGGGYGWSQLSTTNYTKSNGRPDVGGGFDLYLDRMSSHGPECGTCWLSARFTIDWRMAGTDWQNGSHGPELGITLPRPTEKRHLFFVGTLGIYRFHTSVTEPSNLTLTREQRAETQFDGTSSMGIQYRF